MKMTPGQPIQNFRKSTDKITDKDLEKFKNEGETIDKYKKRFKEIESACIEKSKQYDWEITSKNLNKIYESLV